MKRNEFLKTTTAAVATMAVAGLSACTDTCSNNACELAAGEIQHTVMFNLASGKNSEATDKFLADATRILSAIGSVRNFKVYKQVSKKTNFDFQFSMVFQDQKAYDTYNNHPDHVAFVANRWVKEVVAFQEADFIIE